MNIAAYAGLFLVSGSLLTAGAGHEEVVVVHPGHGSWHA